MSVANFLKGLGAVVAVVATAAVEANEKQTGRNAALSAEQAEADKWESRRTQAYAGIERALTRHNVNDTFRDRNRHNKAVDLRREADVNCRNRSEPLMGYTEVCIARFEKNGY